VGGRERALRARESESESDCVCVNSERTRASRACAHNTRVCTQHARVHTTRACAHIHTYTHTQVAYSFTVLVALYVRLHFFELPRHLRIAAEREGPHPEAASAAAAAAVDFAALPGAQEPLSIDSPAASLPMVAVLRTPIAVQGKEGAGEAGGGGGGGKEGEGPGGGGEHSLEVVVAPNEDPLGRQL
jgi:hypothetical protein